MMNLENVSMNIPDDDRLDTNQKASINVEMLYL